jgi:hypothetical protein
MPYAPGVEDISGQLRAQGKRAKTSGIAQGAVEGFQAYQQNKFRNSVLQGENEGLLKAFMSDPETAKYAPADLEKFIEKTQKGGGLSLKDNIQMNGMLNATLKTRSVIEQQKEAQQMQRVREQEMKARALQIQSAQQEQEAVSRLQRLAQSQQGVGSGVLRADVQDRNAEQLKDPVIQFAAQVLQATGRAPSPTDLRAFIENRGGGAPTTAMKDTDAIIQSELKAGKLKAEAIDARRAELLTKGGRDVERYDNAGTFVDTKTGADARIAVKDRSTGQVGFVKPDGKFEVVDPAKWKPSTVGNTNPYMDPEPFSKFATDVISKENAVRSLTKFIKGAKDLPTGVNKIATRIGATAKTILGEELSDEEKKLGVARARQQRLLGALRTTILGPGVLTEIDAQRILNAVGGDVDAITTNPQVMNEVLAEIMEEKMRDYESSLDVYNANVAGRYGTAGYKQREKVPVEFEKAEIGSAVGGVWDENKEKRLEELRRKLGK